MSQQKSLAASLLKVDWKLYGDGELEPVFGNDFTDIHVYQHTFLETVSRSFQEDLLNGIPLKCPFGGGSYSKDELLLSKKYERFLKTLENYASYHDTMAKSPSRRTLVWWCSTFNYCGGLGDRIRGTAYALLLAMISRRKLLIVWPADSEGVYLHPHMINWKDKIVSDLLTRPPSDMLDSDDFTNPYHFSIQNIITDSGKVVIDVTTDAMEHYMRIIGSNETNVILSTNLFLGSLLDREQNGNSPSWLMYGLQWHGLSHLSNDELNDVVGVVFRYLFKLDDEVLEGMSAAMEVLSLNHSPFVAVHVRTGFASMQPYEELKHHPAFLQNDSDWKHALHCAVKAANELLGKNTTYVFLTTDSYLVKEMALSKYGMRIRTLKNILIHVDMLEKEPHTLSAEEKEGFIVVWVELLLMAQGEILVMGESGFSQTAGLLCGLHDGSRAIRKIDNCS